MRRLFFQNSSVATLQHQGRGSPLPWEHVRLHPWLEMMEQEMGASQDACRWANTRPLQQRANPRSRHLSLAFQSWQQGQHPITLLLFRKASQICLSRTSKHIKWFCPGYLETQITRFTRGTWTSSHNTGTPWKIRNGHCQPTEGLVCTGSKRPFTYKWIDNECTCDAG